MSEIRNEVLNSFDDKTGYFYHTIPHRYTNFIDGMAWVGLLCGASLKVDDREMVSKCKRYLETLISVGKDARNFAPYKVSDSWLESKKISGMWYKEKPQINAGVFGLFFAKQNGLDISVPNYLEERYKTALNLKWLGWGFGFLSKHIEPLRQHINTMYLVYLLESKKVPWSMRWMEEENPFFSYINGKKCVVEYPDNEKLTDKKEEVKNNVVPLKYADPSSWIFRRDPFKEVIGGVGTGKKYVRIAELTATYLQETL